MVMEELIANIVLSFELSLVTFHTSSHYGFVRILKCLIPFTRVRQLAYVTYVRKLTFMIRDMRTLTRTLIFFPVVFYIFQDFSVYYNINCLKSYCYIFDLWLICLSLEETDHDVYICIKENLLLNFSYKLFNK